MVVAVLLGVRGWHLFCWLRTIKPYIEGSCLNAASFGPPIPTTVGSLWNCGEFHVVQDASSVDASPLV